MLEHDEHRPHDAFGDRAPNDLRELVGKVSNYPTVRVTGKLTWAPLSGGSGIGVAENQMAKTLRSTLSGVWLMQTVKMRVPAPCRIEYTVRHKGKGKNELRVRFGSFFHLVWAKAHDFDLEPGESKSRKSEQKGDGGDDFEDVRWRLSRKALTKEIDWELTYTVTRLEDETDATSECDHTLTSEK